MSDAQFDAIKNFLQTIEPSVTVGSVLLAFFVIALQIGKFFWEHEREIASESIERISEVLGAFKDRYIRPTIEKKTYEWVGAAYLESVKLVAQKVGDVIQPAIDAGQQIDPKLVADIFTPIGRNEIIAELSANDMVEAFYSSKDGVGLLEKLDAQYLKAREFKRIVDSKISACRNLVYLFFALACVPLFGLLHLLVHLPLLFIYFLGFAALTLALLVFVMFIKFEVNRRKLASLWEDLKTIGSVDA